MGDEGQSWEIGKFLLGNERTSVADTRPNLRLPGHTQAKFAHWAAGGDRSASKLILARNRPGANASLLRIRGTEVPQNLTVLALEFEGPLASSHDWADLFRDPELPSNTARRAGAVAHE